MGNVREDLETYYDSLDNRLNDTERCLGLYNDRLAHLEDQFSQLRHDFNLLLNHLNLRLNHVEIHEDYWEIEPLKGEIDERQVHCNRH